MCTVKKAFLF
jgi:hypothetical protein